MAEQGSDLLSHIEDSLRNGDFLMSEHTDFYVGLFTRMHQAEKQYGIQEACQDDEFTKREHTCGGCGRQYVWSADDIAWKYEASPFMPCGCAWDMLDRAVD